MSALFKIAYGLFVVTSNDGSKDNGMIVNTVTQVANNPDKISVSINKLNYSHDVIKKTGIMNVNILSTDAPFAIFQKFGFQSGKDVNKFEGETTTKTANGLVKLDKYINAFISLKVDQYVDLGSHGLFICSITESEIINDKESMSYSYYHANVKPKKPQTGEKKKKGFICKICGYIYEGEELPPDFVCPLCKHGVEDFEPIE